MTIRPTGYLDELRILTPDIPNPANVPVAFDVQNPGTGKSDRGELVTVPPRWEPLPVPAAQQGVITEMLWTSTSALFSYENRVLIDNRTMQILKWRIKCTVIATAAVQFNVGFISAGISTIPQTGNGIQTTERFQENFQDTSIRNHHNPNQGGAGPVDNIGTFGQFEVYGGRPIYYRIASPVFEMAQNPVDFGGDPNNIAESDHGGDQHHPTWYPFRRFWQRYTGHWSGLPTVSRNQYWQYSKAIRTGGISGQLLYYINHATTFIGRYFDQGFSIDLATGSTVPLAGFIGPGAPVINGVDLSWTLSKNLQVVNGSSSATPVPSGYVAVAFLRNDVQFAVAVAAKIKNSDDNPFVMTQQGHDDPNNIDVNQSQSAQAPDPEESFTVLGCAVGSKSLGKDRRAGWIGRSHYILAGHVADVLADLGSLYASGALDLAPETDLPSVVTDGTRFPTPAADAVAPPPPPATLADTSGILASPASLPAIAQSMPPAPAGGSPLMPSGDRTSARASGLGLQAPNSIPVSLQIAGVIPGAGSLGALPATSPPTWATVEVTLGSGTGGSFDLSSASFLLDDLYEVVEVGTTTSLGETPDRLESGIVLASGIVTTSGILTVYWSVPTPSPGLHVFAYRLMVPS